MKISDILLRYDTDKVSHHNYGDAYNDIFSKFNRENKLDILEIGTQKGGSLCAWKDYFPNSNVTGVDIVDVVKPEYRRSGINFVFSDIKDWVNDDMYDIIIDDGSHFLSDVEYVAEKFSKQLKPNGVMIIEDVQDPKAWVWNISRVIGNCKLSAKDLRGNYDDFLIIITK